MAWEISEATYNEDYHFPSLSYDISGLSWKPDGGSFYISNSDDNVYQYDCSNAWDMSSKSNIYNLTTLNSGLTSVRWGANGNRLYIIQIDTSEIIQYNVSTPWQLSSASQNNSISTQDGYPYGFSIKNDGTKMWESSYGGEIYEYDLSDSWEINSANYSTSISAQDTRPRGIFWKDDGTKFWEIGSSSDLIYEYNASTPWSISSLSFSQSISTQGDPGDIVWKPDGTQFFEVSGQYIYQYQIIAAPSTPQNVTVSQI